MKKPFFIAEIGLNHNGDIDLAKEMVVAAKNSGAHAVKFQSFTANKLITNKIYNTDVRAFGFSEIITLGAFLEKVQVNYAFYESICQFCRQVGIEFLSTPFDTAYVDALEKLGVEKYKIASGDITNFPLIGYVAKKGKPIILSTGAATTDEIAETVDFIQNFGNQNIILLHCVSVYPTPAQSANLGAITELKNDFDLAVGFSDHTAGYHVALAAIAIGAEIIEKHFTIDKNLPGPDQKLAADPEEFKKIVNFGQDIYIATNPKKKQIGAEEKKIRSQIRRSIVAANDLKKNHVISKSDIDFKRPGHGLSAKYSGAVLGRKLIRDVLKDEFILWEDLND